jgi:hypothetical protein
MQISHLDYNKKQVAKTETAGMKFLRSVTCYTRKDLIRNNRIREELNIFNVKNKIQKSGSDWKYHILQMGDRFQRKF